MVQNRTVTIKGVFASSASTVIPSSPVPGASYRDTAMTGTTISQGWAFKTVVDSSEFNEALYEYSYITKQLETCGFLPWSNLTDYVQGAICLGSNNKTYQALQATGPGTTVKDPVSDTGQTYWKEFLGQFVTLDTNQTISGTKTFSNKIVGNISGNAATVTNGVYTNTNQTLSGNKTFSGTVTLNGSLSAGTSAKNTITGWCSPNYSATTSYSKNSAVPNDGFVFLAIRTSSDEKTFIVTVNSNEVYSIWQRYRERQAIFVPVKKGDKVNWSGTTFDSTISLHFVPCVGG